MATDQHLALAGKTGAFLHGKAGIAQGPAHTASLLVDMATLLCVLIAIVLVLWLPKETPLT